MWQWPIYVELKGQVWFRMVVQHDGLKWQKTSVWTQYFCFDLGLDDSRIKNQISILAQTWVENLGNLDVWGN